LSPSPTVSAAPPQPTPSASSSESEEAVVGTVVRFTREGAVMEVTIGEDNPTVRDFLSLLPTTVAVEEYAGAEKIAYLQRELETAGSPGSDPENGDLIYYAPWGNLGFYYDASGIGYSDQTIHLGRYDADADVLAALEGDDVAIDIAPR
jgi:hypothetical protein